MQPNSSGNDSSLARACCPPTRICTRTALAPSAPMARSGVQTTRAGWPWRSRIRLARPPTTRSRSAFGSTRTSSSTAGSPGVRRAMPSTSSGVYVDAPPTTVSLIGPPRVGARRSASSLDPGQCHASDEGLLGEEEDDDDRQHDDQGGGHGQVPLHAMQVTEGCQAERQGPVVRVLARIEQRPEVVVPGEEEHEQRRRGDAGFRQWQDDLPHDAQLRAAVRAGRIGVLLGNGQEELPDQEDREGIAEEVRQDEWPQRARQVPARPEDIERYHGDLRRQHHHHEDAEEGEIATAPTQPGKRVGGRNARRQHETGREDRIHQAVDEIAEHRRVLEDLRVIVEVPRGRPEVWRERLLVRHHGRDHDEGERREEDQRERDRDAVLGDERENPTPSAGPDADHGPPDGQVMNSHASSAPYRKTRERRSSTTVNAIETTNSITAIAEA